MTQQTQRTYTSDAEAYSVFVGQITPQEFVAGYEESEYPIDEAVADFIWNFNYEEEVPTWLEAALYRYVESALSAE